MREWFTDGLEELGLGETEELPETKEGVHATCDGDCWGSRSKGKLQQRPSLEG